MRIGKTLTFLCLTLAFPAVTIAEPPLPEHKILSADLGTWDATVTTFEGSSSSTSKGVETNEILPGGLWLASRFEGTFAGEKFEGRGLFGFDTSKKKYVGTWVDSMTSSPSILEGSYDAKAKTMTYTGDGYDPNSKSKYSQKMVTEWKEDGTRVFSLYMKFDGAPKEEKFLEIVYTKRK